MQLQTYITRIQDQLVAAAALGDDRAHQIADVLAGAVEPALRLAILEAVSAAADDVTAALLDDPGSPVVSARIDGEGVAVDVRRAETDDTETERSAVAVDDSDVSARISLRLSDTLKVEIETAARAAAVSVNTWLVRAAAEAVGRSTTGQQRGGRNHHRVTGWLNG